MALVDEAAISRRRRVTYNQLETLWEFLNSHNEIAVGFNKSLQAREHSKRLWITICDALNSHGDGAIKDWKGWANYWVDYKAKLKKRVAAVRSSQNRTGGGPADVPPLNELEQKFLRLLGDGFGFGLPNIQVNPFPILQDQSNNNGGIGPVVLPSSSVVIELSEEIIHEEAPLEINVPERVIEELPQEQLQEQMAPIERRPRRPRRQNRSAISQEAARQRMLELGRERLEQQQQNATVNQGILQGILQTLIRIADRLDSIAAIPQARNEGSSDR